MIPQYSPWLKKEDLDAVKEVVDSTWVTEGKVTAQFEEQFAKFIGAKHPYACKFADSASLSKTLIHVYKNAGEAKRVAENGVKAYDKQFSFYSMGTKLHSILGGA